uniref:Uncharacterized protein n=1 Tax=Oryza nivara TaxID=4536 RepID=A0A0E0J7R3_ORYNI
MGKSVKKSVKKPKTKKASSGLGPSIFSEKRLRKLLKKGTIADAKLLDFSAELLKRLFSRFALEGKNLLNELQNLKGITVFKRKRNFLANAFADFVRKKLKPLVITKSFSLGKRNLRNWCSVIRKRKSNLNLLDKLKKKKLPLIGNARQQLFKSCNKRVAILLAGLSRNLEPSLRSLMKMIQTLRVDNRLQAAKEMTVASKRKSVIHRVGPSENKNLKHIAFRAQTKYSPRVFYQSEDKIYYDDTFGKSDIEMVVYVILLSSLGIVG